MKFSFKKIIIRYLLLLSCCVSANFCSSADVVNFQNGDTVILASSNQAIAIDNAHPFQQVMMKPVVRHLSKSGNIHILLENSYVEAYPDGVYEMYITTQKKELNTLRPDRPEFVGVLDLYGDATTSKSKTITINASKQVRKIMNNNGDIPIFYVNLVFSGNRMPDGKKVITNIGRFIVKQVKLVAIY